MLSKFTRFDSEDVYLFISKFQKIYMMIKLQHLLKDITKLFFFPFTLKNNAKKWLHSMTTEPITSGDKFAAIFLKEYNPMHMATKIRNNINQFCQILGNP